MEQTTNVRILGPDGFTELSLEDGVWHVQEPRSYPRTKEGEPRPPTPAIVAVEGRMPAREGKPILFQEVPIEPGLTVVLGAAGTGKSTTLTEIASVVDELGYSVKPVHLNETDYDDDKGVEQWLPLLHRALAEAATDPKPSAVIIDSLRHFATIRTGYAARLGNSGFDLTTLQALSDLDRAARRLQIRLVASLFLSTYQLTKGDLADDNKMTKILRTIAYDIDGCATTTMLLGPTRRTPGQFYATTRVDRRKTFEGTVVQRATMQGSGAVMNEPEWRSPLKAFSAVSAVGRSDAAVYAARLADYDYAHGRQAEGAVRATASDALAVRDPAAVVDQLDKPAAPAMSTASKLLTVPDLTVDDDFED